MMLTWEVGGVRGGHGLYLVVATGLRSGETMTGAI